MLVSGAGVAGLTCAYWLHEAGHTPVVVERAAAGPLGGYGIDLSGSGYDVAGRMGILDRLAARQLRVDSVALVDGADRITARLDRPLAEKMLRGPYLGLMHSTLEEVLAGAVEDRVEIRHRQRIAALRQNDDDVLVTFADGTRQRFDVVVGADGVHSDTRELVFGPEPRWARQLGFSMACYPVPDVAGRTDVRAHFTEPGRQTVLYPTDTVGTSVALFLYRSQRHGRIPRAERVARLRAAYQGAGWYTPELLAQAPDEPFMDDLTQIELPRWHRGRVVLIGDACGALTLGSAQGASVAMAGGYLLATALAAHPGAHTDAFAAYEARVRPFVAERQRRARSFTRGLVPATRAGRGIQRVFTRLVLRDAAVPLLRFGFGDVSSILPGPSHHSKERQR
ncbi:oxidoreductase [Actinocatenispora thailandica]|uniref:Oxidoreductase n=1 Tax=Actinocatenispora thailandica TaxID=227318 RepID=A0A7R7HZ57_9ACTN|nr:oxidoreductase [Actinocatenispora thailandica]